MPLEISTIEVLEPGDARRRKPSKLRVGLTNELYRGDICKVIVTGDELRSYYRFAQAVKEQTRIDFRYTHANHGASAASRQRQWEDHVRERPRTEPAARDDGAR